MRPRGPEVRVPTGRGAGSSRVPVRGGLQQGVQEDHAADQGGGVRGAGRQGGHKALELVSDEGPHEGS